MKAYMHNQAGEFQGNIYRVLILRLINKDLDGIDLAHGATGRQTLHAAADTVAAPACRSTPSGCLHLRSRIGDANIINSAVLLMIERTADFI